MRMMHAMPYIVRKLIMVTSSSVEAGSCAPRPFNIGSSFGKTKNARNAVTPSVMTKMIVG